MALVAASSSSSAQSLPKKYDVFISFRGEDTRCNFTSHLHDGFRNKRIITYIDYQLPKGDEILPALWQAIEDSYVSVVVFSKNYASSRWCLNELAHIIHCKRDQGHIVIPVFYKVDPSHVRNQTGPYKQAFEKFERDPRVNQPDIQRWKQALTEAANLAGHHDSHTIRDDSKLIQEVVKDVLQKLSRKYPPTKLTGLVGIDDNCREIESHLEKFETIGIWGMGGIGKSTIAKIIFCKHSSHYEGSRFLENVREKSKNGLAELRHKFLSDLLEEDDHFIDTSTTFVESRLSRMKVFVVLDDISTLEQLENLVGDFHCFGPGSRILITTRDKHVLSKGVDKICTVQELKPHQSLELFNLNAFNNGLSTMEYEELTKKALVYAKGIPLALKVLGSYLRGKSEVEWNSALRKLEKSPHEDIQKVLRLSYDGLNHEEKKIFLDIACFLKGESKEFLINLLDSFGFHGAIGLRTLHDKALINANYHWRVEMHDLIQEMGLQIVREESIDELGARSRLSDFGEICDVLANNAGSNKVEGIQLDVTQIRDLHLEADIFKKMHNIRFLKFYSRFDCDSSHVHLPDGLKFLPNKIRYLEWYGFPLKSLPSTFCPEKIVKLFMPNSRLQKLWDGVQDFSNLEKINLSGSKQLKELPDLSKSLNLKDLKLASCESLCDVHSSIWSLPSLYSLMLSGCKKLKSLKSEFPLKSPKWIDVSDCSDLIELPVLSEENTRLALCETSFCKSRRELERELTIFNLDGSTLVGFPRQLSWLRSLTDLALFECGVIDDLKLHFLFDRMLSLTEVWLCGCCNITELPNNTKHLLRLERLRLSCCNRLRSLLELPPSVTTIKVIDCKWLETVPAFEPLNGGQIDLAFWRCKRLNEESCHNIMGAVYYAICHALPENKNHMHSYKIQVEGSRVPQWFKYRAAKSTVTVELPRISDLLDFSFCMAFYDDVEHGYSGGCFQLKWACYLDGSQVDGKSFLHSDPEMGSDQVWIWNDTKMCREVMQGIRRGGNQQLFTDTKLSFEFTVEEFYRGQTLGIRECGAWPVYGSECEKFFRHKEREKNKKRARDADEQMPLAEPNRTKFEVGPHIPELNALLMTMHIT